MKKVAVVLGFVCALCAASALNAFALVVPVSFTATWDPADVYLQRDIDGDADIHAYQHSISLLGFDPLTDTLTSALVDIDLWDDIYDGAADALDEYTDIYFDGVLTVDELEVGRQVYQYSVLGLLDDGLLNVRLNATSRDFWFRNSVLNVVGYRTLPDPLQPVPEPATMLLLGSGLAGIAALKRRKK